jgi:molybdate transport system substrate-binding protein
LPKRVLAVLVAFAAALAQSAVAHAKSAEPVLVFAAASLKNALDSALADYAQRTGQEVAVSYAATPALAKQIEQGAPADLFFSADLDWMDYLVRKGLIATETTVTLLGNELVLVAPADSAVALTITPGFPLAAAIGDGRLAMAATAAVPAGKYGRAALEHLGVWSKVAGRIAEAENVRGALQFVARGEAPLGIVYRSDAQAEPAVKVVDTFPEDSHPPILYPIALTRSARPEAAAVLEYLQSTDAAAAFEAQGFRVVAPGS